MRGSAPTTQVAPVNPPYAGALAGAFLLLSLLAALDLPSVLVLPSALAFASPAPAGRRNGARRTIFVTWPLRKHCVHTRIVRFVPFLSVMCTVCKFGLNSRL